MLVIKLKSELKGQHIHETIFAGEEGKTLRNLGKLVMDVGEWQSFGCALLLGADHMNNTYPRLRIITEGDREIVEALGE